MVTVFLNGSFFIEGLYSSSTIILSLLFPSSGSPLLEEDSESFLFLFLLSYLSFFIINEFFTLLLVLPKLFFTFFFSLGLLFFI